MTVEQQHKALIRRFYDEALNQRRPDLVQHLAVADYVEHDPLPGQREGREGLRDRVEMLVGGLASTYTIEDLVAEGDRVVVRWRNAGTQVGEFAGLPATNRAFDIAGIDIYRMEGGLAAEHWHVVDQLTMLQQLGVLPAPEAAAS
jgi:predicted ester cyclase